MSAPHDQPPPDPPPPLPPRRLRYGPHASQFVLLHYPHSAPPHPLVVFVHGGFWKSEYGLSPPTAACDTLPPDLTAHGVLLAEIEYRRSADARWGWPHSNHDVLAAFNALARHTAADVQQPPRVVLLAHSAGATLALWLAARLAAARAAPLPTLVFALAPVADLRLAARLRLSDDGRAVQRYMHGAPRQVPHHYRRACPTALASALACVNLRLAAAARDDDVPLQVVDSLYHSVRHARPLPARPRASLALDLFSQADHYDLVHAASPAWAHIRHTILSACAPATPAAPAAPAAPQPPPP